MATVGGIEVDKTIQMSAGKRCVADAEEGCTKLSVC